MSVPKSPRPPPSHPMSYPSASPPPRPRPHPCWMCSCWPGQGSRKAQRQYLISTTSRGCCWLVGWGQLGSAPGQGSGMGQKHFHHAGSPEQHKAKNQQEKKQKTKKYGGEGQWNKAAEGVGTSPGLCCSVRCTGTWRLSSRECVEPAQRS